MPKIKVVYNRKNCIGAGSCCIVCPKFWQMNNDGKADLLGSKQNPKTGDYELTVEANKEVLKSLEQSADSCPVQVIKIVKK